MTRMTANAPDGTPCWLDLGVPDIDRAKTFYGGLFGWEFRDEGAETMHYNTCLLDGVPVAAMVPDTEAGAREFWWQVYFATGDCDGTAKRATDAGGAVLVGPFDVMEQGRMAVVRDSVGAQFGLWQGNVHIGSQIVNEPGTLVWSELFTTEGEAARRFYRAVFEHDAQEVPDLPSFHVLARPDGRMIGGIQQDASVERSTWLTYFEVEDADAALRRVREGGGTVLEEAQDTPYGRLAKVADPFGVPFLVMRSAQPDEA
ncbi:VOC family protein [Actinomadura hibisca]|uniref:VOC family protein n=1 Tax=Actinomadura hibisca TaxID=68565 RepID=UPI000830D2D5|nr:VOC family protein [Actinomadura hibisca]